MAVSRLSTMGRGCYCHKSWALCYNYYISHLIGPHVITINTSVATCASNFNIIILHTTVYKSVLYSIVDCKLKVRGERIMNHVHIFPCSSTLDLREGKHHS